ncbi:MAG: agmatine deiminase [Lentisphaerae bacterium RIFOXYA12_FULL_48_11]|nr:MAG: agmatine deiminase [Lentisphaerae bacterium RIFOXYA12_FULL_48_11]
MKPRTNSQTRLPAEWEKQGAVLLAWPHPHTLWASYIDQAEQVVLAVASAISRHAHLIFIASDTKYTWKKLKKAGVDLNRVVLVDVNTNDIWTRDYGPITVLKSGSPVLVKFRFNGWGRKYPSAKDNLAIERLQKAGVFGDTPIRHERIVLEGGSIDSDGKGTILTTSTCLLNPNRNLPISKSAIEKHLRTALGAKQILWLNHGQLEGDDTDAHVDTLARFAPNNAIVYVSCSDKKDRHYTELKMMEAELKALRTLSGSRYKLFPLPWPAAKYDSKDNRMPATYANFLIINGAVLVPVYKDKNDQKALRIIRRAFPGYKVDGIDCRTLIRNHGSLHCITMQIPSSVFEK